MEYKGERASDSERKGWRGAEHVAKGKRREIRIWIEKERD
jgi:hypothetical protein